MKRRNFNLLSICLMGLGICFVLSLCLIFRVHWPSLHGSWLHSLGRSHVFFIHFSIGSLFAVTFLDIFSSWKEWNEHFADLRLKFHQICHLLFQITLIAGALMELIEHYPNDSIREHYLWGIGSYIGFTFYSFLSFRDLKKPWKRGAGVILAIFLSLSAANTARLGGILHKGLNFFY